MEILNSILNKAFREYSAQYIKNETSFTVAIPEGLEREHLMLIDVKTGETLKKINLGKLLNKPKESPHE